MIKNNVLIEKELKRIRLNNVFVTVLYSENYRTIAVVSLIGKASESDIEAACRLAADRFAYPTQGYGFHGVRLIKELNANSNKLDNLSPYDDYFVKWSCDRSCD